MLHRFRTAMVVTASLALLGGAVLPSTPAAARGPSSPALHGLGAKLPTTRTAAARIAAPAALPTSVDLTRWAEPAGDQGVVSSCVTWAIDYGMLGWYARHGGRSGRPFAPMYTYSQINGGVDLGSWPADALRVARTQGSDTRAHYTQGDYDWWDQPTPAEHANAADYKIRGFHTLFEGDHQGTAAKNAIKTALASQHPVSISFPVRPGFDNLMYDHSTALDDDISGPIRGGHEVLALGYNASGVWIENSWGTAFGDKGFARLSWRVVENDVAGVYTIDGLVPAKPAVRNLSVNAGSVRGATKVVLHGGGYRSASQVRFGDVPAASFHVDSPTTITATSPAHTAGAVHVTVTNPLGTSAATTADRFTYASVPTVIGLSVVNGPSSGGTRVVVTGSQLFGRVRVHFGDVVAKNVRVAPDGTSVTVTSPKHQPGLVFVTATAAGGASRPNNRARFIYGE